MQIYTQGTIFGKSMELKKKQPALHLVKRVWRVGAASRQAGTGI